MQQSESSSLAQSLDARLELQKQRIAKHKEFLENRQREVASLLEDEHEDFHRSSSWTDTMSLPKEMPENLSTNEEDSSILSSRSSSTVPEKKQTSFSSTKKPRIEDTLLCYGRKLEEHKEQMRQKYLKEGQETFRPRISETSKKMARSDDRIDIIDRLDLLEKERRERLEKKQKSREEFFTHHPTISKTSQELIAEDRSDVTEINKNWYESREQRLEAIRSLKYEQELAEQTFAPKLNPKTLKIVERMKQQKKRDREGIAMEDYLEKKEQERKRQLMEKTKEHFNSIVTGQPKISQRAAEIIREGSVSDRLYEESFKLNEKKLGYQQQKQFEEQIMYEFQPKINSFLEVDRGGSPVYDNLLKREANVRKMKQDTMKTLLAKEKELHHPKINPVSEEIASRLPHTTKDRLFQTTKQLKQDYEPVYKFQPEINKKSRQIEAEKIGKANIQTRIDRMYVQEKRKKEKLRMLRSEFEQKELQQCTFAPKTTSHNINCPSFEERTRTWEMKRKAKINKERSVVEQKSMTECTFKPSTNTEKRLYESDGLYSGIVEDPLGFEEFVQRQREARVMKEQMTKGVFITGDKWKNELTIPKEFSLGVKKSEIKSLRKPLSPSRIHITEQIDEPNTTEGGAKDNETKSDESGAFSEDDADDSIIDLLDEVPPQGLFSSLSSVSILEGMHHLYQQPTRISHSPSKSISFSTTSDVPPNTTEEWLKRSLQKDEESKLAKGSPRLNKKPVVGRLSSTIISRRKI